MSRKKSKYKSVTIKKKRYYFYKITWLDITGDSGHAMSHEFSGMMPSLMAVSYTHNQAHETKANSVCRVFVEKKRIIPLRKVIIR